jgi:hypothetical protein
MIVPVEQLSGRPMRCAVLSLAILIAFSVRPAGAQVPREPDPNRVRVRLGPLWLTPTLALSNAGVDTNVFNEADALQPKRDFTLTVTPSTDLALRMGRTWLMGVIREDIVWFSKYDGERSANNNYTLNWLVPLTRFAFVVGGNWVNTRERPGFEIDARANRKELAGNGAFEIRALSRTLIGARAEHRIISFDENAAFQGVNLDQELSRTDTSFGATVRHELTPLTSLVFEVGRDQERFDSSSFRDSDSTTVNIGLRFDQFALISGFAQVGFRDYKPLSSEIPPYTGSTASVNVSYVALGSTRLSLGIGRDVQHSFEGDQPYYLQTGITATINQQIYGPLDVEGRISQRRMAYRNRERPLGVVEIVDRVDHSRSYGGGVGYRLGQELRIGFNVEQAERESPLVERQYDGLRYGLAVSYGQ